MTRGLTRSRPTQVPYCGIHGGYSRHFAGCERPLCIDWDWDRDQDKQSPSCHWWIQYNNTIEKERYEESHVLFIQTYSTLIYSTTSTTTSTLPCCTLYSSWEVLYALGNSFAQLRSPFRTQSFNHQRFLVVGYIDRLKVLTHSTSTYILRVPREYHLLSKNDDVRRR